MPAFRMKCRKCYNEFHRFFPQKEFDQLQYGENGEPKGIGCYDCGFPKMIIARSNQTVKDGFKPGFQRNIMKHCSTYTEYKKHLKEMGLIEIGYEELPERNEGEPFFNENIRKLLAEKYGIDLQDHHVRDLNKELQS